MSIIHESMAINITYWSGAAAYTRVRVNTPAKPMPTPVGTLKSRGFFIFWSWS